MSEKTLELKILTPDAIVYDGSEVSSVTLPTESGEITVLPLHIPLISRLKTGQIKVVKGGETFALAVSSGVLEVQKDSKVVVLAERSEMAHLIDIDRAEEAYRRAKEIKERIKDDEDIDDAKVSAAIEKELNRIKIGTKWQKGGRV